MDDSNISMRNCDKNPPDYSHSPRGYANAEYPVNQLEEAQRIAADLSVKFGSYVSRSEILRRALAFYLESKQYENETF